VGGIEHLADAVGAGGEISGDQSECAGDLLAASDGKRMVIKCARLFRNGNRFDMGRCGSFGAEGCGEKIYLCARRGVEFHDDAVGGVEDAAAQLQTVAEPFDERTEADSLNDPFYSNPITHRWHDYSAVREYHAA